MRELICFIAYNEKRERQLYYLRLFSIVSIALIRRVCHIHRKIELHVDHSLVI